MIYIQCLTNNYIHRLGSRCAIKMKEITDVQRKFVHIVIIDFYARDAWQYRQYRVKYLQGCFKGVAFKLFEAEYAVYMCVGNISIS